MRSLVFSVVSMIFLFSRPAAAEEPRKAPVVIESWNDIGGTIPFTSKIGLRLQSRIVLSKDSARDAYEASTGLSTELWHHGALDLTAGYGYDGGDHVFLVALFHETTFGNGVRSYGYATEQRLRYDAGWHHEGFYRIDAVVAGLHLVHEGSNDVSAGFQIGTGPGYHLARVEARFTFGLTEGMADRVAACVFIFNAP